MPSIDDSQVPAEFRTRMMQIAALHTADTGVDPIDVSRFQHLGFFEDANAPTLPPDTVAVLGRNVTFDEFGPLGPLIFVEDRKSVSVLEVNTLLLRPENEIRRAAAGYIRRIIASKDPWLTERSIGLFNDSFDSINADEVEQWRMAAVQVADAMRQDIKLQFAAFSQCVVRGYKDGSGFYSRAVLQPRFESLSFFRPSIWSASQQAAELGELIERIASNSTVEAALTEYLWTMGYVPLRGAASAAGVLKAWRTRFPTATVTWKQVWTWAQEAGTPIAEFHALVIAMESPSFLVDDSPNEFARKLMSVLGVTRSNVEEGESSRWQLLCEAATHYTQHIDALHPGQPGERVACYGWWLAGQFCRTFKAGNTQAVAVIKGVIRPQTELSYRRWIVARCFSVPSSFHHLTLNVASVWAMSLLNVINEHAGDSLLSECDDEHITKIGEILSGYLVASCISQGWKDYYDAYGISSTGHGAQLKTWANLLPTGEQDAFRELISFRQAFDDPQEVRMRLDKFLDLPNHEQLFLSHFLQEAVASTERFDEMLIAWATKASEGRTLLERIPILVLDEMLDVFAEVQQRQRQETAVSLAHVLASALERVSENDRAAKLIVHLCLMSINCGLASPIQRASAGPWRKETVSALLTWRETIDDIALTSEPWVIARIRAFKSVISRLSGPQIKIK